MATKRKMPKKTVELDLGSEGYEGFYVDTWINAPVEFMRRLNAVRERVVATIIRDVKAEAAGDDEPAAPVTEAEAEDPENEDEAEAGELLLELFPSWRGFVDYRGDKIPHTAEGLDLIPPDLTAAMWKKRAEALRDGALSLPLGTGSSGGPNGGSKG